MLTRRLITDAVATALAEDAPWGDVTAEYVLPADATAAAALVARADGVFCGADVVVETFRQVDPRTQVVLEALDGETVAAGQRLASVRGPARGMLTAERVALNFAQRMSGIATLTSRYVQAVAGTAARIVDTRKTTPGLRALEKHAVVAGGGANHRFGLSDAVMLKDNHLAVLQDGGTDLVEALRALRRRLGHTVHLEVEIDRLDQLDAALEGGADTIMLDNFSVEDLTEGVRRVGGRAVVEASGGVDLTTVAGIARTGVDVISAGALTHSVTALDLALDVVLAPRS
ncbi:carboxylating nicotinate-nucleotide diphosphorylase [Georgenia halophila]|uniref:nicotinate-nucleotide diphosphorylase (carboxylating) n=1 Tax=Georgenia halophila TaxID=620889 RepID=A0ABP8LFS6_9MICO